jgi:hypothetical protein
MLQWQGGGTKTLLRLALVLIAPLSISESGAGQQVVSSSEGHSDYVIVRNGQAPAPESFAQELQKYVRLISDVTLPIVERESTSRAIWMGQAAGP